MPTELLTFKYYVSVINRWSRRCPHTEYADDYGCRHTPCADSGRAPNMLALVF
jgi:hypothetical protein